MIEKMENLENFANSDIQYLGYAAKYAEGLLEDIQSPDYDFNFLEGDIRTIYTTIGSMNDSKNRDILQGKLAAIEAGLKDKNSPKFKEAIQALSDLKDLLLEKSK